MDEPDALRKQAELFTRYLADRTIDRNLTSRYQNAITHSPLTISKQDEKYFQLIEKHGWCLPFLDAGLALVHPHSEVRRRLYIMFAILETTPEYASLFLPQQRNGWYVFRIVYDGAKAALKAIPGVILAKAIR